MPNEMWYGSILHVGHIRMWGGRTWEAIAKNQPTTWKSKSLESILVGLYDTENLYQQWDIEKGKLGKTRDTIFHEHVLGHPSLQHAQLQKGTRITCLPVELDPNFDEENNLELIYLAVESANYFDVVIDEGTPAMYE